MRILRWITIVFALVLATPSIQHDTTGLHMQAGISEAKAQGCLPPLCVPPPPPKPAAKSGNHGGNKFKVTGKSVATMQGVSIGCSAVVEMVDAWSQANGEDPRELTPNEAIDNAAICGLAPAVIVKVANWFAGIKDNACSIAVARRALPENNTPRAREELMWGRDGSDRAWATRQAAFLTEYYNCYRQ